MKAYEHNKRWRRKHPGARSAQRARYYQQFGTSSGELWTEEEDRAVLAHEKPDRELAAELDRSVRAIQVRRNRIKDKR